MRGIVRDLNMRNNFEPMQMPQDVQHKLSHMNLGRKSQLDRLRLRSLVFVAEPCWEVRWDRACVFSSAKDGRPFPCWCVVCLSLLLSGACCKVLDLRKRASLES